ncbi:folylpolyglutamate synthase [bacterium BMS3Abin03]|nr:folylpolyglutamate synthase [bacterium BMS3Abin03]HDZ58921.1 bifunctional folylpolyglutamate synthase/dihydrofolate synthase [Ignavibacteriales bacterium]
MNIETSLKKLFSLHTFGVKLGLENVKKFLGLLGDPQNDLKAIHIAGSNGKGSTASFIASILMECGYKVGLYTSPHFVRFNERIIINGKQIPDNIIAGFINHHWDYIINNELTFFEVTTALAFRYFYDERIDYAVIETGLGGRLDATNVLKPLAVVITSISLEHTNVLGNKISGIAEEKAEIIKPGAKVFIGILPDEADSIIERKCIEQNCELYRLDEYLNRENNNVELYTEEIELDEWDIPLKGKYQKFNAALAVLTFVKTLNEEGSKRIARGLENVIRNTGIQGRYEYYHKNPAVIFDSAHNISGIGQFLSEFSDESELYNKNSVLFGVMKDKDIDEMLKLLDKIFDNIYITQIDYERSATIEDLKFHCDRLNIKAESVYEPVRFIREFLNGDRQGCLVVLGSMYLLGQVKIGLEG